VAGCERITAITQEHGELVTGACEAPKLKAALDAHLPGLIEALAQLDTGHGDPQEATGEQVAVRFAWHHAHALWKALGGSSSADANPDYDVPSVLDLHQRLTRERDRAAAALYVHVPGCTGGVCCQMAAVLTGQQVPTPSG
jgi:hypothetical protein